ncbi:MAG: tetratricopeptide repeat protein, partial [Pirellulaceae bacterium]
MVHRDAYVCLSVSGTLRGQDQQPDRLDSGSSDPLILLKQAVSNQLNKAVEDNLTQVQKTGLLRAYEKQLKMAGKTDASAEYWNGLTELAEMYWQQRELDEAIRIYTEIIAAKPNEIVEANAYLMQGWIEYGNRGNPSKSIPFLEKAVEIAKSAPKDNFSRNELAARAISTLGDVYNITGEEEKAAAQFEYLLANTEIGEAAEPVAMVNANVELARIFLQQGKLKEAGEQYASLEQRLKSSDLPANLKINLSLEAWRGQSG